MSDKIRAAIVGASGYTGVELMRLLAHHPQVTVTCLAAGRSAGKRLDEIYPHLRYLVHEGRLPGDVVAFEAAALAAAADVVFLALPHGEAVAASVELVARGVVVIDLSADFRLQDAGNRARWYGVSDADDGDGTIAALRQQAVYGLPERFRERLKTAALIANPGCYPTATILAAAPLLAAGLATAAAVIVDAKSGTTGAGRTPAQGGMFSEVGEGIRAYKVAGAHRHTPEIEEQLGLAAGTAVAVLFTPHLVPMARGIFSCVYLTAAPGVTAAVAHKALVDAYAAEPFVDVLAPGEVPDTSHVRGSNRAAVAVAHDARTGQLLALGAIDNLIKGASGQAVQCMNIRFGLPEVAGLGQVALFP